MNKIKKDGRKREPDPEKKTEICFCGMEGARGMEKQSCTNNKQIMYTLHKHTEKLNEISQLCVYGFTRLRVVVVVVVWCGTGT